MKQIILFSVAVFFSFSLTNNIKAQDSETGYIFKEDFRLKTTDIENQYRSSTCWSFSSLSFIESEMIRMGKEPVNLSEMFIVNKCYNDKADLYVRMHGNLNFSGGGAFHDITHVMKKYGLAPESVYKGLNYGTEKHVHGEFDNVLKNYVEGVIKNRNKELTPTWKKAFSSIVESYLGFTPKIFKYKGREYTPKTFANEIVGINPDDYIEISSFTHHPFYSKFVLEVPDNWLWDQVYNVPLKDLETVIDNSLKKWIFSGMGRRYQS